MLYLHHEALHKILKLTFSGQDLLIIAFCKDLETYDT